MRSLIVAFSLLGLPAMAHALVCKDMRYENQSYTLCTVQPAEDDLQLFLTNPESGTPFGSFENVARHVEGEGQTLRFAMNAGMYHSDRRPVGHYVENGEERVSVITTDGPGNFGLLPNGVFCIGDGRAEVYETMRFVRDTPSCRYATQSGPMLVIDGELHPRFLEKSDSFYIRNGVGTTADGLTSHFVISKRPVNFHTFARFFRDGLNVPQALYLDGNISRLYAPELDRNDGGFPMGPIVGVVGKAE